MFIAFMLGEFDRLARPIGATPAYYTLSRITSARSQGHGAPAIRHEQY
jgi:hypothetical protein